jgi:hypothetical protein
MLHDILSEVFVEKKRIGSPDRKALSGIVRWESPQAEDIFDVAGSVFLALRQHPALLHWHWQLVPKPEHRG